MSPRATLSPREQARDNRRRLAQNLERRARVASPGQVDISVLRPALDAYLGREIEHPEDFTRGLTAVLLGAREETEALIRTRKEAEYAGDPEAAIRAISNSLRRSAGTNFQSLVSIALADALDALDSCWMVAHPVPGNFKGQLAIAFDAVPSPGDADGGDGAADGDGAEEAPAPFILTPDLDILLRNAAWDPDDERPEPILLLSVKTSIADRGGMAARWKTYFDMIARPCPYLEAHEDCAYHRLGLRFVGDFNYAITQAIVAADIYKTNTDEHHATHGELGSGQARANTFMFDMRITTRDYGEYPPPEGWVTLDAVLEWTENTSLDYGLPR